MVGVCWVCTLICVVSVVAVMVADWHTCRKLEEIKGLFKIWLQVHNADEREKWDDEAE